MSHGTGDLRRPTVLRVELSASGAIGTRADWRGSTESVDRVGTWSGGALAVALLYEDSRARPDGAPPLVVAVGDGVRRGLPTAARATLASRAPLTGLLGDGQVGSELGRRLATVCDALVLAGRAEGAGAVLHVAGPDALELTHLPDLAGRGPAAVHAALLARFGPCASLSIGAAGERELPFASLAAGDDPPHFVGRGGLGAVLGRLGLKAVVVSAPAVESAPEDELAAALLGSPRLEARAEGGTLELFGALGARGELRARGESTPVARETAAGLEAEAESARGRRHGCKGCPTPCGWVFDAGKREQGARFGATHALGLNLGLERFDDALALLGHCDEVGADAKEVGAALALLATARERGLAPGQALFGDRAALERALGEAIEGSGEGARIARGAAAFADEVGLADACTAVHGAAVRPARHVAALLGQCASSRGSDPMRTFPFLTEDAGDRARLAQLVAPLPLPPGAEDPERADGKGRLVWWHENLAAALDASGFCAFSAAALLVDGACSVGRLARWIAPAAMVGEAADEDGAARALLAAGEQVVRLQRLLNREWAGAGAQDLPEWARASLDVAGAWPEYRALRGLDRRGDLDAAARARFERGEASAPQLAAAPPARADGAQAPARETRPGRVLLRASGPLARALGDELELELPLPARADEVLRRAAEHARGEARDVLLGRRAPAVVYRDGRRVAPDGWVEDGDRLDLLLVISGGAR